MLVFDLVLFYRQLLYAVAPSSDLKLPEALAPVCKPVREKERERDAACSIISVLTQWGATLVIQNKRERVRERESRNGMLRGLQLRSIYG